VSPWVFQRLASLKYEYNTKIDRIRTKERKRKISLFPSRQYQTSAPLLCQDESYISTNDIPSNNSTHEIRETSVNTRAVAAAVTSSSSSFSQVHSRYEQYQESELESTKDHSRIRRQKRRFQIKRWFPQRNNQSSSSKTNPSRSEFYIQKAAKQKEYVNMSATTAYPGNATNGHNHNQMNPPPTQPPNQGPPDSYFTESRKGEVNELRQLLRTFSIERDPTKKREIIKKVIAYMTLGIDVSRLFLGIVCDSCLTPCSVDNVHI